MTFTREEIMDWLLKDHRRTIVAYANAHGLESQEVIDMLNKEAKEASNGK